MFILLFFLEQLFLLLMIFVGFYLLLTPGYPVGKYSFCFLPTAVLTVLCCAFEQPGVRIFCILADLVLLAAVCFRGFSDGFRKRLIVYIGSLFAVSLECMEFAWLRMHVLDFPVKLTEFRAFPEHGLFLQEVSLIHLILIILVWMIAGRRKHKSGMKQVLPIFLLPLSQISNLLSLEVCFDHKTKFYLFLIIPASYFLLTTVLIWIHWIDTSEQRRKVREALQEESNRLELERFHFEEVEKKRTILNEVCASYQKELLEIQSLLEQKKTEQALEKTSTIMSNITATREMPYSHIPVINAILTEKDAACNAEHIRLVCDLQIVTLEINGIVLCSILGNLLDNAIRGTSEACKKFPETEPVILLQVKEKGNLLYVRTENPSLPIPKVFRPNHGRGTQILKEIASRFNGEYAAEYQNGIYTAVVTIKK